MGVSLVTLLKCVSWCLLRTLTGSSSGVAYGQSRIKNEATESMRQLYEKLQPSVLELAQYEAEMQSVYLDYQVMFPGRA